MPRFGEVYPKTVALTAAAALALSGCGNKSREAHRTNGPLHRNVYYALGDSVAAGLGLPQSPESTPEDKLCGRSPEAYPGIVAADLKLTLANIACSGAVSANLLTPQSVNKNDTLPGQIEEAFAEGNPKLITITIGANDANWSEFLLKCFTGSCDTAANTAAAKADFTKLDHDLEMDLQAIQNRSQSGQGQTTETVLTGYYSPISDSCGLGERNEAWLKREVNGLNSALRKAAEHFSSFVRFAPVNFAGHEACDPHPWVQPLLGKASLHPTAKGQQVMAESVLHAWHMK